MLFLVFDVCQYSDNGESEFAETKEKFDAQRDGRRRRLVSTGQRGGTQQTE
jgi:hypothetical protein